ncbi:MAG: AMP-binding protein [Hahellaceae bacterium]|nr:AMP-binding protein [Hahellaceae bacterium]MCP5211791.1 AMP-binding protein [Hahellaceae bacterium]
MGNGQVAEFTWQRAVGEARRMASYLKSLDLPPKSNIGILSKNCAHWIMTDLAIWMAGHVSVPLYPTLNGETVAYILEHSEAKLLFVGKLDDWETMKSGVPADLKCISYPLSPKTDYETWDDIVAKHSPLQDVAVRVPEELATIVYTSGSTGKPKGVMLSFFNMAYSAEGVVDALNISTDERMLSYLPLSHVFERFVVEMGSLYRGFHLFFAESLDTFVQDLNRAQPTLFLAVPRIWTKFQSGIFKKMPKEKMDKLMRIPLVNRLIKKKVIKGLGLQNVKFAGSGSAPLSDEIMGWYRQLGLELLEGYGMSENFAYSHMTKPGRSRIGYVGEALPGVEVRISEEGEVQVKSPATMMGYYKEPEKTAETMTEDGFLKTGDKGTIDEMGRLKLTGRIKEIFKTSKGKYVAPAPIENRITAHPHIEMVCVAGSEYPQPHALIMLSEDAQARKVDEAFRKELEASFVSLLKEVNASLDPHEHLQFFTVVEQEWSIENNFLTPTMKMKRNVIEDAYKAMLDDWYGRRQPVIWQ